MLAVAVSGLRTATRLRRREREGNRQESIAVTRRPSSRRCRQGLARTGYTVGSGGLSRGVLPMAAAVLLLAFGVALASRSWLAVAAVVVVAALVLLVLAVGVDRAEARLNAYQRFTRTPRGIAFTSIIALVGGVVWVAFAIGSGPVWTILLPLLWTFGILVNVWRLVGGRSEPQG